MKKRLVIVLLALTLLGAACQDAGDDNDDALETDVSSEEFTLTGVVIDAKEGAEPEGGFPEDQPEDGFGGIAIRPTDDDEATNLDDCSTQQDAYVTFYTEETDLGDLDGEDDFPVSLEGQRVSVEGTVEQPAEDEDEDDDADATNEPEDTDEAGDSDDCILVLTEVELATDADADADGGTGAGTGGTDDEDATPRPSGSPEVTTEPGSTPGLPEGVEDTDPIFEGTPNPDECEGQKACREEE